MKAVIFDMDGVLIDSEQMYLDGAYEQMKKYYPNIKKEDFVPTVGANGSRTKEILFQASGETDKDYFNKIYPSFYGVRSLDYKAIMRTEVPEILKWLRENQYKIGLASSSPWENICQVVKECQIAEYFDYMVTGEDFKESKPHPEIYLTTAKHLECQPENCYVIEDSTYGITAGKRAGMCVIAIKDERFKMDYTLADYTIGSLAEIFSIIKS